MPTKKWYQSKAVLGSILTLVAVGLKMSGAGFEGDEESTSLNAILAVAENVGALTGIAMTIWGRATAKTKVTL